jgi:hypothetical protein
VLLVVALPVAIAAAMAAGVPAGGKQRGWMRGSRARRACAHTAATCVPASCRPAKNHQNFD